MTERTDTSRVIMVTGGGSGIGRAAASWQQVDVSRRESIEAASFATGPVLHVNGGSHFGH
jgi:hypothetical protein